MTWLALGVMYSCAYVLAGWLLRDAPGALLGLRSIGLLIPPLLGVGVIVRRRHTWAGCQGLFWATIAVGLMTSAIGLIGWTIDEIFVARETSWLGWHAVFALFGGATPLFALLAQPHRGTRESAAATTAVDIAGLAVLVGFLYSHFVTGSVLTSDSLPRAPFSLLVLSELQHFLVFAAMAGAAIAARGLSWESTYRRVRRACRVLRHAEHQQRRRLAGGLPERVRLRFHVDPAVLLLCVGRPRGAGVR